MQSKEQITSYHKEIITKLKEYISIVKKEKSLIISKKECLLGTNQTDYLYIHDIKVSEDKENYYLVAL